jgi:hypothetical protein
MYIFILVLLSIFTILTILFIINVFYRKETFKSDYSDYKHIDRIEVDDKFAYCIGGSALCKTGVPIKGGVYANGDTYKSYCDDGSTMICNNELTNLDVCGNSYVWQTSTNYTPILFSKTYKGFTEPTSYIPAIINNNSINFYDKNSNVIDTINKCDILGSKITNCKQALKMKFEVNEKPYWSGTDEYDAKKINQGINYNIEPDIIGTFQNKSYTEHTPQSNGKSGMYKSLPCIADYGAMPGDNVCNGEVGLIQDNTLVCPYYKPICKGYRCDSTFGSCDYSK